MIPEAANLATSRSVAPTVSRVRRSLSLLGSTLTASLLAPVGVALRGGRSFLLVLVILDIPLQVGVHLYWSDDLASLGAVGGFEISLTTLALAALYALWFMRYVTRKDLQRRLILKPAVPLAMFLALQLASILQARDPKISVYVAFVTGEMVLLYVYLLNWVKTRSEVTLIIHVLMLGIVLESGIMLFLRVAGQNLALPGFHGQVSDRTEIGGTEYERVGGTLVSANAAAGYLVMVLLPIISLLLFTRLKLWYTLLATVGVGLGAVALLFTYSRGGWLAFVVGMAILLIGGWRLLRVRTRFMCIGSVALTMMLVFVLPTTAKQRLLGEDEGAAASRPILMKLAINMIEEHPLLGVGVNNFTLNIRDYAVGDLIGQWLYAVHNKYLLIWAESGLGALIVFLWFVLTLLQQAWRCWKQKQEFYSPLSLGLAAAICAFLVHVSFEPDTGRTSMQYLVVLGALISAIQAWQVRYINAEFLPASTQTGQNNHRLESFRIPTA